MTLPIADYIAQLAAQDVKLWVEDGKLRCNGPQGVVTEEFRHDLASRRPELLDFLAKGQSAAGNAGIAHRPAGRAVPLTQGQERIWCLAKMEPNSSVYNVPTVFRLTGPLFVSALKRALTVIQRRHEILRTAFPGGDIASAWQMIQPSSDVVLPVEVIEDGLALPPSQTAKHEVERLLNQEASRPFDLEQGPLWRARLFRLSSKQHLLALTMHHIIFDGVSRTLFLDELSQAYRAFVKGRDLTLAEPRVQFADFAVWQHDRLDPAALARQLDYWKQRLGGEVAALLTPNDHSRPAGKGRAGSMPFELPDAVARAVFELAGDEQASAFIVLLTAFIVLLHRHTGQEDIVVCTPMAGRDRAEIEKLIGYFNNIVVMRADVSGNPSFRALLAQVRRRALEAYDNQYVPLQHLAQLPNLVRTPLARAMVSYQETARHPLDLPELEISAVGVRKDAADFDLALYLEREGDKLTGVLDYNAELFGAATITKFVQRFGQVLELAVGERERRTQEFPAYGTGPAGIEAMLMQHAQIDRAVVVPMPRTGQSHAYLTLNEHDVPSLEAVRAYAAANLPDYEMPVSFVPVDQMPLRADGTVDVSALPDPGLGRGRLATEFVAPRTELERRLVEMWKKVLWLNIEVGIRDRFVDLGGHSLLSVQLVAELEQALQRRLPAGALATLSTIEELAAALQAQDGKGASGPPPPSSIGAGRLPLDIYHGLRSYTASWEGKRTARDSVMVGLNTTGPRQALFWCLQRYQELVQLARYLDPEQPVYGMRSGHQVMIKNQTNIDLLAAHYVDEIIATQPNGPYLLGGNCQAALIAFQIAHQLGERGHEITLLFLHEKFVPLPYRGPVALTFGDRSDHNPLCYFRKPEMGWHKYYSGPVTMSVVSGAHGQFFQPPNVQVLAATIRQNIVAAQSGRFANSPARLPGEAMQILPPAAYRATLTAPAQMTVAPGEVRVLQVQVANCSACAWQPTEVSGVFLANRWLDPGGRVQRYIDGRAPLVRSVSPGTAVAVELAVQAPVETGSWLLELDLVDEGVTWFKDQGSATCCVRVDVRKTEVDPHDAMERRPNS